MRPRRGTNPTRLATLITTVIVAGMLLTSGAQAATLSSKIDKILTTQYKAEIAYSNAKMEAAVTAAQTALGSTASAIDELSSSDSSAATALVDELENQYDVAGAVGLFKPALTAFTALAKLPLTKTEHKDALADEADVKHVLAINTTSDITKWHNADYAPGSEPANTKAYGGITGVGLPSIELPISGSSSAIKSFEKLEQEASSRTSTVFSTVSDDWSTWIAGYGVESG
jgi:hypothetical protein